MSDARRYVEFRIYQLKPGTQTEFHQLVEQYSIPMLAAVGMEVVAYGPIVRDPNGYLLIRAYDSPEHLMESQDSFYASNAWLNGPREEILDLIESHDSHEAWYAPSVLNAIVSIMEQGEEPNPLGVEYPKWGIKRPTGHH